MKTLPTRTLIAAAVLVLLCSSALSQNAEKADEFESIPCDDYLSRADFMSNLAAQNPHARVLVFLYEGRQKEYSIRGGDPKWVLPPVGQIAARVRSMKTYFKRRKVDISRIVFVDAGIRERAFVEVWLVPAGAEPPKPTPTRNSIGHSKGKAHGFCTDCCGP